jgi:TonB family protein
VPEFQEYLRLDQSPGSVTAHGWLASCFYQLGQFEQAVSEAKIELASHPEDQNAKNWLSAATNKINSGPNDGGARVGATQAVQGAPPAGNAQQVLAVVQQVNPVYPEEARRTRVQGTVSLHAVIGVNGSVKELSVLAGHPSLTQAAVDAVRQWRYEPYSQNGRAVEVETTVNVIFSLDETKPGPGQAVHPSAQSKPR